MLLSGQKVSLASVPNACAVVTQHLNDDHVFRAHIKNSLMGRLLFKGVYMDRPS